jgi:mono/diheme cytochrome c family protein
VDQGEGFSLLKKDVSPARRAELGPFYLVWQNLSDRVIRAEGDYGWPYQLASVELVDFAARFPKLAPPAGASAAARRGFELYRVHCLKCHSINDEGGKTGPELNYPKSVTEYWRPGPLREWILDPSAFRFRSAMPGLPRELPERGRKVGDIVAYLSAMARRKIGPDPASSPR